MNQIHRVLAHDVGIEEVHERALPPQQSGDIGYTKLREFSFEVASDNEILSGDVDLHFKATSSVQAFLSGTAKTIFDVTSIKKKYGASIEEVPNSGIFSQINDVVTNGPESCLRKVSSGMDDLLLGTTGRQDLSGGIHYKIPVDLTILKRNQWLHLPATGPLILTFRCVDDKTCLYAGSGSPVLTITECKLICRFKKMSPGWIDKMVLKAPPIMYNFERIQYWTQLWNQSYNRIELNKDCRSATTLLVRFRLASQFNAYTSNNTNKSIAPDSAFTKISLTHNGRELRPDQDIVNHGYMLEELFRVFGLRNDNDNGSLVKRSNFSKADVAGLETVWAMSTSTSCPQYYLAFDLSKNGVNSGLDLLNGGNLVFSTTAAAAATAFDYTDFFLIHDAVCVVKDRDNLEVMY